MDMLPHRRGPRRKVKPADKITGLYARMMATPDTDDPQTCPACGAIVRSRVLEHEPHYRGCPYLEEVDA